MKILLVIFIIVIILLIYLYYLTENKIPSSFQEEPVKILQCGGYFEPQKDIKIPFKIITSCTTSPTRINKMYDTLYTLQKQTVKPSYLFLNLPNKFARTNESYIIPDSFINNKNIIINRFDKDYGSATKLVGAILKIPKNEDTWIVVHDDDQLYFQKLVENYIDYITQVNNKKIVFTVSGYNFKKDYTGTTSDDTDLSRVQVCEGFMSYCLHRSVFEDDFIPYMNFVLKNKDCYLSDDLIISNYIAMKNASIQMINSPNINRGLFWRSGCLLDYGLQEDALHSIASKEDGSVELGGHFGKYMRSIEYLKKNNLFYLEKNLV
jgi:hypothetical protein